MRPLQDKDQAAFGRLSQVEERPAFAALAQGLGGIQNKASFCFACSLTVTGITLGDQKRPDFPLKPPDTLAAGLSQDGILNGVKAGLAAAGQNPRGPQDNHRAPAHKVIGQQPGQ